MFQKAVTGLLPYRPSACASAVCARSFFSSLFIVFPRVPPVLGRGIGADSGAGVDGIGADDVGADGAGADGAGADGAGADGAGVDDVGVGVGIGGVWVMNENVLGVI